MTRTQHRARPLFGEWRRQERFADAIIHELLDRFAALPIRSRLRPELFYGVLRNLEAARFLDRTAARRHDWMTNVARHSSARVCTSYSCLERPHTPRSMKRWLRPRQGTRSLINAVLRTALRRANELRDKADAQPLRVRFSHPDFLDRAMEQAILAKKPRRRLCEWNNRPRRLRADQSSQDRAGRILRSAIREYEPTAGPPGFRRVPIIFHRRRSPRALSTFRIRARPSPANCSIRSLDENVLDACAAPGGKTRYLAQLMQNQGTIRRLRSGRATRLNTCEKISIGSG